MWRDSDVYISRHLALQLIWCGQLNAEDMAANASYSVKLTDRSDYDTLSFNSRLYQNKKMVLYGVIFDLD